MYSRQIDGRLKLRVRVRIMIVLCHKDFFFLLSGLLYIVHTLTQVNIKIWKLQSYWKLDMFVSNIPSIPSVYHDVQLSWGKGWLPSCYPTRTHTHIHTHYPFSVVMFRADAIEINICYRPCLHLVFPLISALVLNKMRIYSQLLVDLGRIFHLLLGSYKEKVTFVFKFILKQYFCNSTKLICSLNKLIELVGCNCSSCPNRLMENKVHSPSSVQNGFGSNSEIISKIISSSNKNSVVSLL